MTDCVDDKNQPVKITMHGKYAERRDADAQGQLLPGRELAVVLSVSLAEPIPVCYQSQGETYRVRADGLRRTGVIGQLELVPVLEPAYNRWTCIADVPFGAEFSRRGEPARVRLLPTVISNVSVILDNRLCLHQRLFEDYEWTTDGITWHRCWKRVRPEPIVAPAVEPQGE